MQTDFVFTKLLGIGFGACFSFANPCVRVAPLRRYANVKNTSKGILTGIVNNGRNSYAWVGETETRAETNTKQFGDDAPASVSRG